LSEKIVEGLAHSKFGAVILSPAFFAKHWPRKELAGLRAREEEGHKVILPVWHNVDKSAITQFSPVLADVLAANTELGIDNVAERLLGVIFTAEGEGPYKIYPSVGRRLIELLDSNPDKEAFVGFLRSHMSRASHLDWDWGASPIVEKYRLYDLVFDAYALYAGHGINLTLIYFTDVWKDPFEDGPLRIREEISKVLSAVQSVQSRFYQDTEMQGQIRDLILRDDSPYYSYLRDDVPNLRFFVYAGRRSEIDASPARHDIWSQVRNYSDHIEVRSYDRMLDQFLPP
jgi:hypothetical protein